MSQWLYIYCLSAQFTNPKLTVKSPRNITEGDRIDIECTTVLAREYDIEILIQKDKKILSSARSQKSVTYSAIATVENNGTYTCKVELGSVSKTSSMNIVVAGRRTVNSRSHLAQEGDTRMGMSWKSSWILILADTQAQMLKGI